MGGSAWVGQCVHLCMRNCASESIAALFHFYCVFHFSYAALLSSDLPPVPSSPSTQSGATTADKGPSTEIEALTTKQQGMIHAVTAQCTLYSHVPVCTHTSKYGRCKS